MTDLLCVGMFGGNVNALQRKLQELGLEVSPLEFARDFFGPSTRQTIIQWQKAHGLPASGDVDARTADALDAELSVARRSNGDPPVAVPPRSSPGSPQVASAAAASAIAASMSTNAAAAAAPSPMVPPELPVAPTPARAQRRTAATPAAATSKATPRPSGPAAVPVSAPASAAPTGTLPAAAAPSASIAELAATTNLGLSPALQRYLAEHRIVTLSDVRRAGGLTKSAAPADGSVAQLIDAHANLALVSADIAANAELITQEFPSPQAIVRTPWTHFMMMAAPALGEIAAARVHATATALSRTLDQIIISARVDAANGIPTGLPSEVDALLSPADQQSCQCCACSAALSPTAYLADLIVYVLKRLRNRGQPVSWQFLVDTFHQPFVDLPIDCDAVDRQVRQVRICIEVLRSYLLAHPPSQHQSTLLQSAEDAYRMSTYSALLTGLGTTYDEVRLAVLADRATRSALADRLGLTIDPYGSGRPDDLDRLLLDAPFIEGQLERLFGFADTTRNPLSDGPTVNDANGRIARWNLKGIAWGKNTDPDGAIYVTLTSDQSTGTVGVSIYKESHRSDPDLVGSGSVIASGTAGIEKIAIGEANGSGLGGTTYVSATANDASIELGAVPLITSWQLQTLRAEWLAEDHPAEAFVDGISATQLAAPQPIPIPFPLRPVLRYDASAQVLFYGNQDQGVMAPDVLDQLLAITPTPAGRADYAPAVRTLYVRSQRPPVIDPDVIGPDDFRVPTAKTGGPDQPFDVWLRRRNWVDAGLIRLASLTKIVNGVAVPDIDAILAEMSQSWTYGTTTLKPWRTGTTDTPVSQFETVWENLAEAVDADVAAIVLHLGSDLALTVDSFNRLMEIWHQDRDAAIDPRNPAVTPDAWRELYSLLVQSVKVRFFASWRQEEKVSLSSIPFTTSFFGSDTFVVSLREPVVGDWPPDGDWPPLGQPTRPLIDPLTATLPDLPETATDQVRQLWQSRLTQIAGYTAAIRAARETAASPGGAEAALKVALGNPLPADPDQLARDLLSGDPNVVASATATIRSQLFMSVDEFNRLMMIRAMDQDTDPAGWPTPSQWVEFYLILTAAETRRLAYPTWLMEESHLIAGPATWTSHKGYWLARKATLPRWRSSVDLRTQWHAALALRSRVPIIDPDLITTADLANPFAGDPAFDRWNERTTWVDTQLQQLQQPPLPPSTVAQIDAALQTAIGISGADLAAIGTARDAGENTSPRLAQLGLTSDAFDHLLTIRRLVGPTVQIRQPEWDAFWSILVQVIKQRQYGVWLIEEADRARPIVLGPDEFQLQNATQESSCSVTPPPCSVPGPTQPPPLNPWRATLEARQAWLDTLTARVEQQTTVMQASATLVDSAEGLTLPQLRNALVDATDAPGADFCARADWLTTTLMIDAQTGGCQKTTRIEQALETLQGIMNGVRDGQVGGFDVQLAAAPAAISSGAGPDRIDVFAWGGDGALWHKWWDGASGPAGIWQDWESLGGAIASAPTVTSAYGGFVEVFARGGIDAALWHYDGRLSAWEQVGDVTFKLFSAPTAVASQQGSIDVFALGSDFAPWQISANFDARAGAWSWGGWQQVARTTPTPPPFTSAPAAFLDSASNYHLFVVGGDGALWSTQQDATGAWSGWTSLGIPPPASGLTSDPVVLSFPGDFYEVFVRGSDRAVWQYRPPGRLTRGPPWTSIGGIATQGPGACWSTALRVDVFIAGVDRALWHNWALNDAWQGWQAANELTIDDHPDSQGQRYFDEEWKWMGSYATWRAAIGVYLYPEDVLQPTLRKWQTPAFQTLVNDVQANPTLTPAQAAAEANKYADYFSDVCSMNIEVSTPGVDTQIHDDNGVPTKRLSLWYLIGRGAAHNRTYWSAWDSTASSEYAQTFWDFVPGFVGQNILSLIDAVPYATPGNRRFLCLFARAQAGSVQALLLTRYDLEAQTWDSGSISLDLPESTPSFDAVVMPNNVEKNPPIVRVKAVSGQIYENTLNADATYWETGGWTHLVWTPWTRIDNSFAARAVTGPSQIAAVSRDRNSLDIFVTKEDGGIYRSSYFTQSFGFPWTSFSSVDTSFVAFPNAAVAAVSDGPDMDLFVVGNDGHLHNNSWDLSSDTWHGWNAVATTVSFSPLIPITAIAPQSGHVRAFGVGRMQGSGGGAVNIPTIVWRDNGQWGYDTIPDQINLSNNPGFTPTPIEAIQGDDGYHLFAAAFASPTNFGAYEISDRDIVGDPKGWGQGFGSSQLNWPDNPVLQGSESFGTRSLSISVVHRPNGSSRWDAFAIGDDGGIHANSRDKNNPQWGANWVPVTSPQERVPQGSYVTILSRYPNLIDLFVVRTDGGIWSNNWDDNRDGGSWLGWFRIGSSSDTVPPKSTITAISRYPDHIDLFVVGNDGGVYTASWDVNPDVFWITKPPITLPNQLRPYPAIGGPFDIPERLSSDALQQRRWAIKQAMEAVRSDNPLGQLSNLTYLEEAYYFVPVYLAEQLQKQGQYTAALDWFRTVYDYSMPVALRNIYYGFELEKSLSIVGPRHSDWLLDPLNPHLIAATRRYAYARYTILSIVQCLLDYADAQFTYDTAESDAHARTLYMTALALLGLPIFDQSTNPCEGFYITLAGTQLDGAKWRGSLDALRRDLARIDRVSVVAAALPKIQQALASDAPWGNRFAAARVVTSEAKRNILLPPTMKELFANQDAFLDGAYAVLQASPPLVPTISAVTTAAGIAFDSALQTRTEPQGAYPHAVAAATTGLLPEPKTGPISATPSSTSATTIAAQPGTPSSGIAPTALSAPPSAVSVPIGTKAAAIPGLPQSLMAVPDVPFFFCVPPNPLLDALRSHANNALFKLRNCMNIAGMRRQIDPYSASTNMGNVPTTGAAGQISIPGAVAIQPTPYAYAFLIDRAQKLAQTAVAMEAAMLSAFEKYDQNLYTELEARQGLQVAVQTVQLQSLAAKQATDGVGLAQLQQQRAETEIAHAQQLLTSDIAERENTAIDFMQAEAGLQILASVGSAAAGVQSAFSPGAIFEGFGASSSSAFASSLSYLGSSFGTFASINQARANQEVQQIDWQYQSASGRADYSIAGQQITIAQDQVAVANQQLAIARLQADQKTDVVNFLTNKFTNSDLYSWMSSVLLGVYGYFLRQATAVARMAESQMAFELQEAPPGIIAPDYWRPPSRTSSTPTNIQGLTGAERLTQDITTLDQYRLDHDKRKLQLTKTLSLAQLYPLELQRLRDTGVMNFITPMRLFDQDFPGHYLRLIQKVTTSVIALIPPSQGIRATLSTNGATRVVTQELQKIVVRRDPQMVALSSPTNATGVFTLDPQSNLLLPFQDLGVEAQWEFSMPKAANQFDYSTIADVLITIDYTALDSPDYRLKVLRELADQTGAERPFSFRNDLADQWYDLHNPDQTATPMTVQFTVARTDFPANIDDIRIRQVLLYFSRADGQTFEVTVSGLRFAEGGGTSMVGGAARTVDGAISTRRGNATSWMPMIGKTPFGTWQLTFPNTEVVRDWFAGDLIGDILFDITYSARTPPHPQW